MSNNEQGQSTSNAMKVYWQSYHIYHGDEFHTPKSQHVFHAAISYIGINVIQAFVKKDFKVLLEDFGEGHCTKEDGGVNVLISVEPRRTVRRMHPHEWEGGKDVWVGLL